MYLLKHPLAASRYYAERAGILFRDRVLVVSEKIVSPGNENRSSPPAGFEIRVVTRAELDGLSYPEPGGWLERAEAERWLEQGFGRLVAAVQANEIVAYCWLETGVVHLDFFDMDAALGDEDYYISKVFVAPKCRRGYLALGLSKALAVEAIHVAAAEGRWRGLVAHVPEQSAMKHVFTSLGWKFVKNVRYMRVGPVSWFQTSSPSERRVVLGLRKMAAKLFSAKAGATRA